MTPQYITKPNVRIQCTMVGGKSIGITTDNKLVMFPTNYAKPEDFSYLGPATEGNVNSIVSALARLTIHLES